MGEVKTVIPRPVLKKRKREEEWALAKKQEAEAEAAKKKNDREIIDLKREAKLKGEFYVEPEAKLLFIACIRGINAIDRKTKKILQPYVTYGYPQLEECEGVDLQLQLQVQVQERLR
ncbi:hypothetical protein ACFE04_017579 [Oxalis oulophora]